MTVVPEPPITIAASRHGGPQDHVHRIVIHDEEYPVSIHSAEDVANYFAKPLTLYQAHYAVDADSVQHCVPEDLVAYHAPPNPFSVGIEQDGYARFTPAEWALPGSQGTIKQTAKLAREIADRRSVGKRWLTVADLKSPPPEIRCSTCANRGIVAASGITSHANVSLAFGQSTHTDPGPSYPIDQFMALVLEGEEEDEDMASPLTEGAAAHELIARKFKVYFDVDVDLGPASPHPIDLPGYWWWYQGLVSGNVTPAAFDFECARVAGVPVA